MPHSSPPDLSFPALQPRSSGLSVNVALDGPAPFRWWLLHACFLASLVVAMILCLGIFEAIRFSTFILQAPCSLVSHEIIDLGVCQSCEKSACKEHPVAAARMIVNFRPTHSLHNVTGIVWHCKPREGADPCLPLSFGLHTAVNSTPAPQQWRRWFRPIWVTDTPEVPINFPAFCDLGSVYAHVQKSIDEQNHRCFYNSRDPAGYEVFLKMPTPLEIGTIEALSRQGVPLMCVFGGVALFIATLFGCLSLQE